MAGPELLLIAGHRLVVDPSVVAPIEGLEREQQWSYQLTRAALVEQPWDDMIESTANCVGEFEDVLDQDVDQQLAELEEERAAKDDRYADDFDAVEEKFETWVSVRR